MKRFVLALLFGLIILGLIAPVSAGFDYNPPDFNNPDGEYFGVNPDPIPELNFIAPYWASQYPQEYRMYINGLYQGNLYPYYYDEDDLSYAMYSWTLSPPSSSNGRYIFELIHVDYDSQGNGQETSAPGAGLYYYDINNTAPAPVDSPYIDAVLIASNTHYNEYRLQCMPDSDYKYLGISQDPDHLGYFYKTSQETICTLRVNAGGSITVYALALNLWTLEHIPLSRVLVGPPAESVINATTIKDDLQNISNPIRPSENNPIRSGDFQPIGKDAIINSPFGNLISNGGLIFSLPHMDNPQQLRENLLNGTGNLTAPLYDAVDSITGAVLFIPSVISGALSSVVSALLETVDVLKSVFESVFGVIDGAMDFIYYILPTVYLFIPDAVWWCIIAILCYYIFKWILLFIFGYDVVNAYFEKGGKE